MVIPIMYEEVLEGVDTMRSRSDINRSKKAQSGKKTDSRLVNLITRIKQLFVTGAVETRNEKVKYDPYGSELEKAWEDFENGNTV
jgi:hypothetical protein